MARNDAEPEDFKSPFPEIRMQLEDLDSLPGSLEDYWGGDVNFGTHEEVKLSINC